LKIRLKWLRLCIACSSETVYRLGKKISLTPF